MRVIKFLQLALENVKSHRNLTVDFGERTDLTGDNGMGKSTIPQSISYALYNIDANGSKLDPTPITYDADITKASLLLEVDGKQLLLTRSLKKGKAQCYVNEVPTSATKFNELVSELFDKDLFLSLFNPNYFFTMHWEKQRAMLLQYISAPLKKEVLKHVAEEQAKHLEPLLKKHSIEDLKELHKDKKKTLDKKYIAAQSKTKTLKEQLEYHAPKVPLESLKAELKPLLKQRKELDEINDSASDVNGRINVLHNQINNLNKERDSMKADWAVLKNEQPEGHCRVCKQPLQDEALEAARDDIQQRTDNFKSTFNDVIAQRTKMEEELKTLEYIDVSEQRAKLIDLQSQIEPIEKEIAKHREYEYYLKQVEQASAEEKECLELLNESIFILDTIKDFKAKEAELQGEKVQALFTTLSVRLFKKNKTDGEIKPDFEIEMDGKPYSKLSLSETIRAGLELRDVLSEQSELIAPVFIDNAESITRFKEPIGQLITCRVVAGQELKIKAVAK
ncbi:AAA family ATPase [Niallia taxi]|uniref:AAA family ATPase n=1 Tax=Niallia taxi TaxID=2499688 RepID=UPI00254B8DD1|nr:AAA family ATPase [Niallia taxi]MDK8641308.1 ATPase [Niallia taxi]